MYFNDAQAAQINNLVAQFEKRTGAELVAAVIGRCDSYPEIPWKAFALTFASASLLYLIYVIARPHWITEMSVQLGMVFVLGIGAAIALLSIVWPAFARLFLNRHRAETESEQYARSLFLERELFRTHARNGILLLVSIFERKVVIVPDSGIAGKLSNDELESVIAKMAPHLRGGDRLQAFVKGIEALETLMVRAGLGPSSEAGNQIPDAIIQQRGDDR